MPAVPYKQFPVASKARRWDVAEAEKRGQRWASSDGSGDREKIDWPKLRQLYGWYDSENAETLAGLKLMHHDIVGGSPQLIPRGLYAAMAALNGGRGGVDIPSDDRKPVWLHLSKSYADLGEEAPALATRADASAEDLRDDRDRREFGYWTSGEPVRFEDAPAEVGSPDDDGRKRSAVQILRGGMYFHPWWGAMRMDRQLMENIARNFERGVQNQQLMVDLNHDARSPAQGWIERVWMIPGDASLAPEDDLEATLWEKVRWTDLGVEHIEREHFKYTSVEYWDDFKNNQGKAFGPALTGTALTNVPFITGMAELALSRVSGDANVASTSRAILVPSVQPASPARAAAKPTRGLTMAKLNAAITKVLAGIGFSTRSGAAEQDLAQEFIDRIREELGLEGNAEVSDGGIVLALNAAFEGVRQDAEAKLAAEKLAAEKALASSEPAKIAVGHEGEAQDLSQIVATAVERAAAPLRTEILTLKSTLESKDATVQELVARSQRIETERDEDRFLTRFLDLVRSRKVVPAMRETLRKIWDADQTLFESHVASLPTRPEFAGPIGSDGVNEETDGSDADTTRYYDEVQRLVREEKLGIKQATRKVREEHPEWYNEHKIATGRGARELMQRRRQAERMLQDTRTA